MIAADRSGSGSPSISNHPYRVGLWDHHVLVGHGPRGCLLQAALRQLVREPLSAAPGDKNLGDEPLITKTLVRNRHVY
jgi:hypothetical protein